MTKYSKKAGESFDKAMADRGKVRDVVTRAQRASPITDSVERLQQARTFGRDIL